MIRSIWLVLTSFTVCDSPKSLPHTPAVLIVQWSLHFVFIQPFCNPHLPPELIGRRFVWDESFIDGSGSSRQISSISLATKSVTTSVNRQTTSPELSLNMPQSTSLSTSCSVASDWADWYFIPVAFIWSYCPTFLNSSFPHGDPPSRGFFLLGLQGRYHGIVISVIRCFALQSCGYGVDSELSWSEVSSGGGLCGHGWGGPLVRTDPQDIVSSLQHQARCSLSHFYSVEETETVGGCVCTWVHVSKRLRGSGGLFSIS